MQSMRWQAVGVTQAWRRMASRGAAVDRAIDGCGSMRSAMMYLLATIALSMSGFAVAAEAPAPAPSSSARAYVDFRIVIPETLHIDSRSERRAKSQAFVSRTRDTIGDRTVVTVARP